MSIDGLVNYRFGEIRFSTSITGPWNFRSCLDIKTATSKLEDSDSKFGAVKFGQLQVEARLRPAWWVLGSGGKAHVLRSRQTGDETDLSLPFLPDALPTTAEMAEHFLGVEIVMIADKPVITERPYNKGVKVFCGIVLHKSTDLEYSRVGYFENSEDSSDAPKEQREWLVGGDPELIAII
jgi:hypothetical protein